MHFTITHPMHRHPYNPELVSGDGHRDRRPLLPRAAGIHGFGFTDHPAPSQRWLEAGGPRTRWTRFVGDGIRRGPATTTLRADPEHRGAAVIEILS